MKNHFWLLLAALAITLIYLALTDHTVVGSCDNYRGKPPCIVAEKDGRFLMYIDERGVWLSPPRELPYRWK